MEAREALYIACMEKLGPGIYYCCRDRLSFGTLEQKAWLHEAKRPNILSYLHCLDAKGQNYTFVRIVNMEKVRSSDYSGVFSQQNMLDPGHFDVCKMTSFQQL